MRLVIRIIEAGDTGLSCGRFFDEEEIKLIVRLEHATQ